MARGKNSSKLTGFEGVGCALSGYLHNTFRRKHYHILKISLQVYPGMCKVVLTLTHPEEGALVCFMNADTLEKCLDLLEDKFYADTLKFYPDRYATPKFDKKET